MHVRAKMASKRLLDEFDSLDSVESPTKAAKLHGVVTSLSPMKSSSGKTAYFEGHLTDETTSLRMVGFNTLQQKEIAAFQDQKQTVTLDDCQIQKSRYGAQMEVLLKQSTSILSLPKKLHDVVSSSPLTSGIITLAQLPNIQKFQTVSVTAKVLTLSERVEVKPQLYKQDITLSDATGTARMTVWQTDIDKLEENESYEFKDLLVNSFNNLRYLSPPKSGFSFTPIDDIGTVEDAPVNEEGRNEMKLLQSPTSIAGNYAFHAKQAGLIQRIIALVNVLHVQPPNASINATVHCQPTFSFIVKGALRLCKLLFP